MKPFTYISPKHELDDQDFGILGILPWKAECSIDGEKVSVYSAKAQRWVGLELKEIDITDFVQNDRDLKELILKQYRRERELEATQDVNRAYDEWKNGDGAA